MVHVFFTVFIRSGFVNMFLSWKFWVPIGKLTYIGYLIHEVFLVVYQFNRPNQQYYYDYAQVINRSRLKNSK